MKKKYLALVLEDDPTIIDQLVAYMGQTNLFAKPYICSNTTQAISALYEQQFDVLYLDIELPDMSALDMLRMFPSHPPVCAISAHPAYAVDCYDLGIDDFMAKPLNYPRFMRSLPRSLLKVPGHQEATQLPKSSSGLSTNLSPNHIYLKTGRQIDRFIIDDIVYLEAFHIYSKLFTGSSTVVVNEQLSKLEQRLTPNNFLRVHKSFLINLSKVTQFKANTVWLGDHKIPIGGTFKSKLQERLKALGII